MRCLKQQSLQNFMLILVDDGSTDGTAQMVCQHVPQTLHIRGNGTWWWAGSLQRGFDAIDHQPGSADSYLLIMNDDTEFGPAFLETGIALLDARKRCLVMAIAYDLETRQLRERGCRVDWPSLSFFHSRHNEENHLLATRGLFLRVRDRREIGDLYPRWLPHYLSDWEFTYRAYRKGFRLLTVPRLWLLVNEKTTGYSWQPTDAGEPFMALLRKLYSRKSKLNPLYLTAFVLLACPWRWKLQNVGRARVRHFRLVLRRQA